MKREDERQPKTGPTSGGLGTGDSTPTGNPDNPTTSTGGIGSVTPEILKVTGSVAPPPPPPPPTSNTSPPPAPPLPPSPTPTPEPNIAAGINPGLNEGELGGAPVGESTFSRPGDLGFRAFAGRVRSEQARPFVTQDGGKSAIARQLREAMERGDLSRADIGGSLGGGSFASAGDVLGRGAEQDDLIRTVLGQLNGPKNPRII